MSGNPVKKIVGGITSGVGAIGGFLGGKVGKTLEKVGGEIIRGPGHLIKQVTGNLLGQQQQIVYADSEAATNSADTTPLYQTSQSTGSDQFDTGESPSSAGSSSILIGNKSGNIFLGKQSLLGKRK